MTVITGATGQLGAAFSRLLPDATTVGHGEIDLAQPQGVFDAMAHLRPDSIINCAAYTAVDAAELHADEAHAVNARAVGEMARYAAAADVPLLTFSTDYVFAGDASRPYVESSPTAPVNTYGATKLAGERLAFGAHPGTLVVRTSWLISGTHRNFVSTMIRLAGERDVVRVVADQQGRPTIAADLAIASLEALRRGVTGVLHLANEGATTWYELAQEAVGLAGLEPARIQPCRTSDYPTRAKRPAYSVLGTERGNEEGVVALPNWRTSLPGVVSALIATT